MVGKFKISMLVLEMWK